MDGHPGAGRRWTESRLQADSPSPRAATPCTEARTGSHCGIARVAAEEIFEQYLTARGITWAYEVPAGESHPDYWLDHPAQPVCEVRHVTAALLDQEPGPVDPYKPIAKAVKRKAKQGRALEGAHPYVVVIWAPDWPTDFHSVSGALFGKIRAVMPVDPATGTADSSRSHVGFGRDASLHSSQHEHVSAVAVIDQFNPGLCAAEAEIDGEIEPTCDNLGLAEKVAIAQDVFDRRTRDGLFEHGACTTRLVTYHNMHATTPLPLDVFDGPFDEQYSIGSDGTFTLVFEGDQVSNRPR